VDCDEADPLIHPGADEECNGRDDDCDGFVDDDDPDVTEAFDWYPDLDGDGWGDATASPEPACAGPEGWVDRTGDCDDGDAEVHPEATEDCDGRDDDCNGVVDDAPDAVVLYADRDLDGYGDAETTSWRCGPEVGWVEGAGDCDDLDATAYPGAPEHCDGADDDCDGVVDSPDPVDEPTWYADGDGDGWGTPIQTAVACEAPAGFVPGAAGFDCDDTDAGVNPSESEHCDGVDEDCDGRADEDPVDGPTWYLDADGDGYGDATARSTDCVQPPGYVADGTDCDDGRRTANPGADEHCDGTDDDCDGAVDEASAVDADTWYRDLDRDGFGDPGFSVTACSAPAGYVGLGTDCDDGAATIYPGATERCDGIDQDCDGASDNDRVVTFVSGSTVTDLTATFRLGTVSSPAAHTVSSSGILTFCGGTYWARLTLSASPVEVRGFYGADATVLSAAGTGRVISAGAAALDVTLDGLELQDGANAAGQGGAFWSGTAGLALEVDGCRFLSNAASQGAGLAVDQADVTLASCEFSLNEASSAGGAVFATDSAVEVYDTTFDGNEAVYGGALYLDGGSLLLDGSLVQDNFARHASGSGTYDPEGAGLYATGGAAVACTALATASAGFVSNTSLGLGGGAALDTGTTLTSDLCDWGADGTSDDNSPADLHQAVSGSFDFGDAASFACSDLGCW